MFVAIISRHYFVSTHVRRNRVYVQRKRLLQVLFFKYYPVYMPSNVSKEKKSPWCLLYDLFKELPIKFSMTLAQKTG